MKVTPEMMALFLGIVLTVLNIIDRFSFMREKASSPIKENAARITALEKEVENIKDAIFLGDKRISTLEDGTRVLLKSMGALLSHGIDGSNIDEMRTAREELNDYLIRR